MSVKSSVAETEERFWAKVNRTEGKECWEWTAAIQKSSGYGIFRLPPRSTFAHRASWFFAFGVYPEKCVLHRCDNKLCVRPNHLFLGTRADNCVDMLQKGRSRCWNTPPKLSRADIRKIRKLLRQVVTTRKKHNPPPGSMTKTKIAKRFGVSVATICLIYKRKRWGSIT